ncbi:GcrA family cell cycle regulator [Siccirubricoccus sp. G192]|uniref:GcrA family cell cycle regulator n=1 Tax=Siccirubricoccus sp. G192 TaxID=2849651 RepID=UPI001C2CA61A|nr:GcrA family cell cycle regulator [Siccirubricoccus sp. G192]MBV1795981.1 GcrA family cell cycle regulator [Siccirubricoccus sp. G192]
MDWTAEAIDQLRGFWAEGHSTAEIGRRMGISKNAVVGKAHRLDLPARPSPIRREAEGAAGAPSVPQSRRLPAPREAAPRRPEPALASAPAAARMPAAAPTQNAPAASAVVRPFPRLSTRSCCWPLGEPGTPESRFCEAAALTGKPYCTDHAAVAYVKARDRREDAA